MRVGDWRLDAAAIRHAAATLPTGRQAPGRLQVARGGRGGACSGHRRGPTEDVRLTVPNFPPNRSFLLLPTHCVESGYTVKSKDSVDEPRWVTICFLSKMRRPAVPGAILLKPVAIYEVVGPMIIPAAGQP